MALLINDCHIHLGQSKGVNKTVTIDDIIEHKKEYSILNMFVMCDNNEEVYKLLELPYYGIWGLQWLTEETEPDDIIQRSRIRGCKYHGAYNYHPKPRVDVLELLDRYGAILMMHTGRYKDANISSKTSYLHSIEIAQDYPNIKLIMAHMGGTDTNISMQAINEVNVDNLDNVYFDTSGITTPFIIEYAVKMLGSKQILFGSDIPWCSFKAMFYTVQDAQISSEEKENIFYHNMNRLLK